MATMVISTFLAQKNKTLEDGCSAEDMQAIIEYTCSMSISTQCPELCAYFINKEYEMDEETNDPDRMMKFASFSSMSIISSYYFCSIREIKAWLNELNWLDWSNEFSLGFYYLAN